MSTQAHEQYPSPSEVGLDGSPGLALVAEVASILTRGSGLAADLTAVADALGRVLGDDGCRIWIRDAESGSYRPLYPEARRPPPPDRESAIRACEQTSEVRDDAGRRWSVLVPLLHAGERLGVLEAVVPDSRDAPTFRHVLRTVAAMVAPLVSWMQRSENLASAVVLGTQEVDAQRRFTSKIIDSLPLSLYVIDREYRVQAWNRNRETGTQGVGREQALGRPIFDVLHRMPRELLRKEFDSVFRTGRIEQVNVESTHTGATRHYRITKIPMCLHDESVSHVITLGEDLTDFKAVQQQVAIAEKLSAIGQLAAGVMHEINNPLATIGACVEALSVRSPELEESIRANFEEYLRIMESELDRCKAIVDGLLDFSRPTSRVRRPADLNQIVEDALFLVKHHDRFRRIQLQRLLAEGLPRIDGNTEQLIQVFVALFLNAIDAMEGRGVLSVTTERNAERDAEVTVHITDTGMGIPRDDLPKIFEPFYTSKQPGQGTGLGLAICYGIVAQHRGRIVVDSQVGHGSTFSVYLPVASRQEPA